MAVPGFEARCTFNGNEIYDGEDKSLDGLRKARM